MNQDNLYKKLRIICLILAIVCMGLSLLKKANAEEMNSNIQNNVDEILNQYFVDLEVRDPNIRKTIYSECPYVIIYPIMLGSYQYYIADFYYDINMTINQRTSNNYIYINGYDLGIGNTSGYIYTPNAPNIPFSSTGNCYRIISNDAKSVDKIIKYTITSNIPNVTSYSNIYYLTSNYTTIYSDMNNAFSTHSIGNPLLVYTNKNGINTGKRQYTYYENTVEPITNNTDGFDVYKYGASGSERLVCDFSSCISISNAVGNSSTIQINITIDGVDQTFNFDSTSSYYDYSVSGWRALYSIPFTAFGINSNTISARLTNVTVANTTSSPGGSGTTNINWVTPLTLVGSEYEDLEPEDIPRAQLPDFDKFDDEGTQTNYNGTINRWLTSANSSFDYSLYTRWNFEPKYYIIPVIYYGASQAAIDALKAALNLDFGQAIDDVISIAQGVSIEDQIQEFMQENYYLNDLYDILVFAYQGSSGADTVYYIFTTDSYNNHLSNSFLYDVLQAIYDDGKAIEKTYDFLYDKLTDFEDKSLTKFNEMVGLQELENGFISSLQSILNQILNALLNLNIDIPEADYSSITSRLDTIISNQGSSSINNDWYQNYRSWLYAQDSTDNIISPHEFFIEIFDPIKNTYDAFVNNNAIAGYIADMDLFVEYLSGKIDDNLSIYFKDSIGSPNFDINDNTMLTAGGIQ